MRFSKDCTLLTRHSYNCYLAVAARAVRRSLKEEPRLAAEKRGEMDLRFAKWQVRDYRAVGENGTVADQNVELQNGKQGENKNLASANASAMAEHAGEGQQ